MKKAALISVSDRTGLADFARVLHECGYVLLATSGSSRYLAGEGIETLSIEEYTGQREILDGRVKTLHPRIHAGLLAKRFESAHLEELAAQNILPIDVAVVNLYPFIEGLQTAAAADPEKMAELVDVGGPTMIRAAAKNHGSVWPVIDPADYEAVAHWLRSDGEPSEEGLRFRRKLAAKVFMQLASYDLEISRYFAGGYETPGASWAPRHEVAGVVLSKAQDLRYGENPHQQAAFYRRVGSMHSGWRQLQGKELSYNNLLDFDAAFRIARALPTDAPAVAIVKHMNPCGAASGSTLVDALARARMGDPRSHFGGIIAFNRQVDAAAAAAVIDDFTEIVTAPAFAADALKVFEKRKNLRIIETDFALVETLEMRSVQGGILLQQVDPGVSSVKDLEVVSKRKASAAELQDLQFGWALCAHVKSNAIVIVKDQMLLATGGGQMSRIDAVETALMKAKTHGHDLHGAVAASDAFFPFTDCIEALAAVGVTAVVAPSGAKRDDEILAAADKLGMSLLFSSDRHFRH